MADIDQSVTDEVDVSDVSLIDTPIAPKTDAPEVQQETGEESAAATEPAEEPSPTEADDTPATEPEPAAPAQDAEAERKAIAQREYLNRQRTRNQVTQQLDQTYGPKTEEQLVEEGVDPAQAQIQALREEMAFKEQRAQIAELNAGLQAEAVNVYNDFPVFNPNSKDFDQQFAEMVENQYKVAARLQADESGIVLNAEVPLYDFYKQMATIYSRGATKGSQQGQQDALQMMSRTENPGGSSSTSGNQSDSLADLEERLGDVVIT